MNDHRNSVDLWRAVLDDVDEHPDAETTLVAFVDGTLDAASAEVVEAHLAECEVCREDVADLREVSRERSRSRWLPAAAAIVLVAAGVAAYLGRDGAPPPARPRPPIAPVATAARYADPAWAALVRDARDRGVVALPDLSALRPAPETYRGESTTTPTGTFAPIGEVVESARPRFNWPRRAGERWVVSVFAGGERVAQSKRIAGAAWQPEHDLPRGVLLTWQAASGTIVLPAPPHPPATFRVASAAAASELDAARRAHGGDHLLLGLLYAKHGILERAEEELELYAKHHNDARTQQILDAIRRARL